MTKDQISYFKIMKTTHKLLTGKTGTTSVCEFNTRDGRAGLVPGHVIMNTGLPGAHCNKHYQSVHSAITIVGGSDVHFANY